MFKLLKENIRIALGSIDPVAAYHIDRFDHRHRNHGARLHPYGRCSKIHCRRISPRWVLTLSTCNNTRLKPAGFGGGEREVVNPSFRIPKRSRLKTNTIFFYPYGIVIYGGDQRRGKV
jgi:hypothetical protein